MKLEILNLDGSEGIIVGDIKGVEIDVFFVDDNNRNWLVTF